MKAIRIPHPLLLLSALILAALSCGLPSGSAPAPTPGPPATPAIFLPPEWTPTPGPPTPEVPADWQEFHAGRVHLWLPGSFEGGNVETELPKVVEALRMLGAEYADMAEYLEQNPGVFVLWVVDTVPGPSGRLSNINVTKEAVPETVSLEEYLDASVDLLPSDFQVVNREIVTLGDREAGKLVLSVSDATMHRMSVIYVIRDGAWFWNVTYASDADDFVASTPTWETSIHSFWLDG